MLLPLLLHQLCFYLILIGSNEALIDTINFLTIRDVNRTINLSTHLAKVSNSICVENTGKSGVNVVYFAERKSKVVYIEATDSSGDHLEISEAKVLGYSDNQFWKIQLNNILQHGSNVNIRVEYVVNGALSPYPKAITQNESQFVCYFGNHYFYTPYLTINQKTILHVGTQNIESYSDLLPFVISNMTLIYGPYDQIKPFSENFLYVHFENNSPFLAVTQLKRVIEVSHWGNIAVEETLDIRHTGAVLKGGFSRYEYNEKRRDISSIKSFKTLLPAAASDVYYRDVIGNISSSHIRIMDDCIEIELRPRFPLFGGWKTHYILGYNIPTYEYLFNKNDFFKLKMRVVDHVVDDMVVDEAIIKIILPEGAHSINLYTPYPVLRLPDRKHFTYLDIMGRPVITIMKSNVVENHIMDFELSYIFPQVLMLQEPLILILTLYLFFIFFIIYSRLDFSISRKELYENQQRVSTTYAQLLAHQDKRAATYDEFDRCLYVLKTNRDSNAFHTAVKSINAEYKAQSNYIVELLVKLKSEAPGMFEKMSCLQTLDKNMKDLFKQQKVLYLDLVVPAKISRQAFSVSENLLKKKKDKCVQKINAIRKTLH